jgi:hypothetical protein
VPGFFDDGSMALSPPCPDPSRTPKSPRNSTPYRSNAASIAARLCSCMDGRPSARSARWIEDCEIPDRSDSSRADQFSRPRAARIWAEVILVFSLMAFLACPIRGRPPSCILVASLWIPPRMNSIRLRPLSHKGGIKTTALIAGCILQRRISTILRVHLDYKVDVSRSLCNAYNNDVFFPSKS